MVEDKTPQYCGVCGTRLVEDNVSSTRGFDVFTGERLVDEHRALNCPNPTYEILGRGIFPKTRITTHPSWYYDNGTWTQ